MKRIVSCLLAVCIMAMTSFTAFAEIPRVTEETKEFTFWAAYNPNYQTDWENIKAWQYFEEATGVHVNWELYANSGEMAEKLNVLIASGDLSSFPDAFYRCGISASQLKRYGPEGLFLDIYDLVQQYAPGRDQRLAGGAGSGDERHVFLPGSEQQRQRPHASQAVFEHKNDAGRGRGQDARDHRRAV